MIGFSKNRDQKLLGLVLDGPLICEQLPLSTLVVALPVLLSCLVARVLQSRISK